jgi:hypothetical protein
MNLFGWLLVGHLVGDFLLQTRWMAEKKAREWPPLLAHCFVYTAVVALLALPAGGLSPVAIGLVFFSHILLDRRNLTDLWAKSITGTPDSQWLKTMIDQSWHIVILAVATLL